MVMVAGLECLPGQRRSKTLSDESSRTDSSRLSQRARAITPAPPGQIKVAKNLSEVTRAWGLVYDVYSRSGFIHHNDYKVHTTPQAVNRRTAVFYSEINGEIESTLSAILDGPDGLPLDKVYKAELDTLRGRGRRLTEHGLLAHRVQIAGSQAAEYFDRNKDSFHRSQIARVRESLIHLMCRTYFFGLTMNCTDIVIGVHPKHAKFYDRGWGFVQAGPQKAYPTVNNRPVVLMRMDIREVLKRPSMPYGLDFCLNNPIAIDTFQERCRFDPSRVIKNAKSLHLYLQDMYTEWEQRTIAWAQQRAC